MRYIPLTESDRRDMLKAIGVASVEDLFRSIPEPIRMKNSPNLPPARTESELKAYFQTLALKNLPLTNPGWAAFLGAGAYEHFIPALVDSLTSREEFLTAYTPYQPELSQGTLQVIFEFQSMVANLFGMDVANASMYDGASAVAEAALMALRIKRNARHVLISKGLHPDYRRVIHTYLGDTDAKIQELELDPSGRTIVPPIPSGLATLVIAQPNFYGVIESLDPIATAVHAADGLLTVTTTEAMAFGVLKGPGAQGADIVAGEGQAFGNPVSFGGPWVGLFAAKNDHVRQMPGRIAGKTTDQEGKDAYCLTLATREQHIRREKATSNICTNQALCALRACVYLAAVGERGLQEIARRNVWAVNALKSKLSEIRGVEFPYTGPVFNEMVVRLPISTDAFLDAMEREKILGGVPLSRWEMGRERDLLVTVTETKDKAQLDRYVAAARKAL
ncbi:MAG: aminomethyl-transferring glycine dehydrogenase subunit GcvPA [Pseudomonadota bacterium]